MKLTYGYSLRSARKFYGMPYVIGKGGGGGGGSGSP